MEKKEKEVEEMEVEEFSSLTLRGASQAKIVLTKLNPISFHVFHYVEPFSRFSRFS